MKRSGSMALALARWPFRSLASVALLALAPKCVVCLAVYAGLGALLGIRSQELCGASGSRFPWGMLVAGSLLLGGTMLAVRRRLGASCRPDSPAGPTR